MDSEDRILQLERQASRSKRNFRPQLAPVPPGQIRLASFNIRIYSTGSRDDTELGLIADRLQQFDLVAIQERNCCYTLVGDRDRDDWP